MRESHQLSTKGIEATDTSINQRRPHRDCPWGLVKHIGLSNVTRDQFNAATRLFDISPITTVCIIAVRTGSARITAAEAHGAVCSPAWHPVTICDAGPDEAARLRVALAPIAENHNEVATSTGLVAE
jgi:hypothetical protein